MPRRSAAALSVVPVVSIAPPRPEPPADLTAGQLSVWRLVTGSLPAGYFAPDAAPLLASYCRHADRASQIEGELVKIGPGDEGFGRLSRLAIAVSQHVASLGRALRLNPNTRIRPDTAAHRAAKGGGMRSVDALFAARRARDAGLDD